MTMESIKSRALVICHTYNQSQYIEDTLNGFCEQQTDFPYVCLIIDDASTDGEGEVINNYLIENFDLNDSIFFMQEDTCDYYSRFAQHIANKNCYFLIFYLKYNHYQIRKSKLSYYMDWRNKTKYIAYCEGDDYWIDPLKLQKQVDFLEKHQDFGLVHTNFKIIDGSNNEIGNIKQRDKFLKKYEGNPIDEILVLLGIKTLTFCARREYLPEGIIADNVFSGDKYRVLNIVTQSKIHYMPDVTGIYRSLKGTACHATNFFVADKFERSIQRLDEYFLNRIPSLSKRTRRLMMFKWGSYEMIYQLASGVNKVSELPPLLLAFPYVSVRDYKLLLLYLLIHSKKVFNMVHNRMIKKDYYRKPTIN